MPHPQTDTILPVKPRRLEEKNAISYLNYLNEKIEKRESNEGDLFWNDGKTFASLLMATLLSNTHHSLKMYCTGLRPGILCGKKEGDGKGFEGAYWEVFKTFFTRSNIDKIETVNNIPPIQILIQTDRWKDNLPFKRVFDCQNQCPGKIEIKRIKKSGIQKMFGWLNNTNTIGKNNFAIFDNHAYRIEYDPDRFLANGSFYDKNMCKYLGIIFDKEFANSDPVINPLIGRR